MTKWKHVSEKNNSKKAYQVVIDFKAEKKK